MSVVGNRPNKPALIVYLDTVGIDASRVKQEGVDETGYDYIQVDRDGRPVVRSDSGRLELQTQRKEWPSAEVWENVKVLLAGGNLGDIGYAPDGSVVEKVAKPKATGKAAVKADGGGE